MIMNDELQPYDSDGFGSLRSLEDLNVFVVNKELQNMLSTRHINSIKKVEPYLLRDPKFIKAVESARKNLGLPKGANPDIDIGEYEIIAHLAGRPYSQISAEEHKAILKTFQYCAFQTLESSDLPYLWYSYVAYYICNLKPPEQNPFFQDKIYVDSISSDGEMTIKIRPGIVREDYIAAWKILTKFALKPSAIEKPYSNKKRDDDIYSDYLLGTFSHSQLAKKYFPLQDPIQAKDRIVKVLRREKIRQDMRINPKS